MQSAREIILMFIGIVLPWTRVWRARCFGEGHGQGGGGKYPASFQVALRCDVKQSDKKDTSSQCWPGWRIHRSKFLIVSDWWVGGCGCSLSHSLYIIIWSEKWYISIAQINQYELSIRSKKPKLPTEMELEGVSNVMCEQILLGYLFNYWYLTSFLPM